MSATAYSPAEGTYPGRPPCAACGANFHLHRYGRDLALSGAELARLYQRGEALRCPERVLPARTDSLEAAERELEVATASGDEARVFVARGNLQRLQRSSSRDAELGGWEPRS